MKWHERAQALLVGEAPGLDETKRGEPFVGKAGIELEKALRSVGATRGHLALTNAICCRPPDNELGILLHRLQKENKRRIADGLDPRPTPMECCRPRLLREMAALPNVITVGKIATESVTGHVTKIMTARGGPLQLFLDGDTPGDGKGAAVRVLPTLHPAFVMRSRRWMGAFRADLARAFRWFTSGLAWKEPEGLYRPSPVQLDAFLTSILGEAFSVFDVETLPGFPAQDHFDPMWDMLRCIGIGTASGRGCVVPFRSVMGTISFYTPPEQAQIVRLLKEYLTSARWRKVTWNGRAYDRQVVEYRLGVVPSPHLDALGLHKLAEPELPHDLGYAGSVHTDVDKWKAGHVATTAQTDMQLWKYCVTDCVVTAQTVEPLRRACAARSQLQLLPFFAKLQDVCVGLHQNGMWVNQAKRREWDRKLLGEAARLRKEVRELAGWKDLNPSSFPQVADLLFERLGVAPHHYTDLGDPSTDDDALRAFLSETWSLDDHKKAIVRSLRAYRKTVKRRGVVVRLRPIAEEYYEEPFMVDFEESAEEKEERERRAKKGKGTRSPGLVLPDGRIHANWLAHGTWGWRFSCNQPNMQNFESRLRDMIEAAPGHVLVACDEAQLELRMVVGLARCKYYIEQFESGGDPHKTLCVDTFGAGFERADEEQKKRLRRAVKELTYSGLYGASPEVQLEVVTSAEDEDEQLIFPDFTLREVSAFRDNWHRRCPEIQVWWDSILAEYRRDHFLTEPILGLRCDFLDGEDPSKLYNFKPQAGGAALAHKALFKALEALGGPAGRAPGAAIWGEGTGLVQQGHDSIVFELPAEHAPWKIEEKRNEKTGQTRTVETFCAPDCACSASKLARLLEECMAEDGAKYGLPVKFAGEAKVARSWKGV
jgi:DNA polymerase